MIPALGEAFRLFTIAGTLAFVGSFVAGCSFSLPSVSTAPEETTGSLRKVESRLSGELDQEDWRRAKAALGVALHPQGNGRPVKWDNPETRLAGEITPAGPPYVESDEVCRKFRATIDAPGKPAKTVHGAACKLTADEWVIRDVAPRGKPANS